MVMETGSGSGGGAGAAPAGVQRKLDNILNAKVDTDPELHSALETVSPLLLRPSAGGGDGCRPQPQQQHRQLLRTVLDDEAICINERFLQQFAHIVESVCSVERHVCAMDDTCGSMERRLTAEKARTGHLLQQTDRLRLERESLERRATVASAYAAMFTLTPAEEAALAGGGDGHTLTGDFFTALRRCHRVHDDCKTLLRTRHCAAAMHIMERTTGRLEAAYALCYGWSRRQCRLLAAAADASAVGELLRHAVAAMQHRPDMFRYCMDEYTTARRPHLSRAFIDALTRGDGHSAPLELMAHEPRRYVADMCGWLHQAAAGERDTVRALVAHASRTDQVDKVEADALAQLMQPLAVPLRLRVEQSLGAVHSPVCLYRLRNVLHFYADTFASSLGAQCGLVTALGDLCELASKLFTASLAKAVHNITANLEPAEAGGSAQPPTGVHTALVLLRDLLEASEHCVALPTEHEAEAESTEALVAAVVDPLHRALSLCASPLPAVECAVYAANWQSAVAGLLALYPRAAGGGGQAERLRCHVEANCDTLVAHVAGHALDRCRMRPVYDACAEAARAKLDCVSSAAGCDGDSVQRSMDIFTRYLAEPDALVAGHIDAVASHKLRESIGRRALCELLAAYESVEAQLALPHNGLEHVRRPSVAAARLALLPATDTDAKPEEA